MTKNPVINAFAASAYISLIGFLLNWGMKMAPKGPDTVLVPIAMISLFTLSAAVMGYLFCFQPGQLYFDGKKKEGVNLFLQTMLAFGCLTIIAFTLVFSGALR